MDNRETLTELEHAALEFLEGGPADLGERTEETIVRTVPRLWDAGSNILAGARLADATKALHRDERRIRTIEAKVARRLAKAGLIVLEHGRARLAAVKDDA